MPNISLEKDAYSAALHSHLSSWVFYMRNKMTQNDELIRALSTINGVKANLPDHYVVEAHWVEEYNSAIQKIENSLDINLEEYKVPTNMIKPEPSFVNGETGEAIYSKELFCERAILLHKVDSALEYIQNYTKNNSVGSEISKNACETQKKVFIVHGHNNEVKESVSRFIEKLQLVAVILHEQPNKGRTIIEKFVEYSDVGFAVILLTADDVGAKKAESDIKLIPRARQNVILELGYFLGRLGREKVFVLYENGVEIPSDYQGVLFEPLDNKDNWKFSLAKELKEAKFEIDLNKLL